MRNNSENIFSNAWPKKLSWSANMGTLNTLLVIACLSLCGSAKATTYNAVNDFSLANNPNGVWSYYTGGTLSSTPVAGSGAFTGFDFWWSGSPVPNSESVAKNITGAPLTIEGAIIIPTTQLDLDPESKGAELRFTAPSSGTYSITGEFSGIDEVENLHSVHITDNGTIIFNGAINSYGQADTFNLVESLHSGDILNFEALTGSTYTYLSTGLALSITSAKATTPEPASLFIAGIGLTALSLIRRRKLN